MSIQIKIHNNRFIDLSDDDLRECAEVKAELMDREARKIKLGRTIEEEKIRISKIKQPTLELNTDLERIVYYISMIDYDGTNKSEELITRVLKGAYTKSWSEAEWREVIQPIVQILGNDINDADTATAIIKAVNEFNLLPVSKKDKLFTATVGADHIVLPRKEIRNTNKL